MPATVQSIADHPLVDEVGDGFVVSISRAPLVGLSEGRSGLLVDAARAGLRVGLVTAPTSRLTLGMLHMLRLARGEWIVRGADGDRSGLTGRILDSVGAAFAAADGEAETDIDFLRPRPDQVGWLQFSISVEHAPKHDARLGGTVELIARELASATPAAWGVNEPTGLHWNRDNITTFARSLMPQQSRIFVAGGASGHPFRAAVRIARGSTGVIEETRAFVALPTPESEREAIDAVPRVFTRLAETERVRFGMAYRQRGDADLAVAAAVSSPMAPVAAVLGPRAVRDTRVSVDDFTSGLGAISAGNPRVPSLVIPFADGGAAGWTAFERATSMIGFDRIATAFGEGKPS